VPEVYRVTLRPAHGQKSPPRKERAGFGIWTATLTRSPYYGRSALQLPPIIFLVVVADAPT